MSYCVLFAIFSLFASLIQAQTPAPQPAAAKLPAIDSPVLYRSFFYFHSSFTDWLTTRKAGKTAAETADLDLKSATALGLKQQEQLQLTALTTSIALELRAIDQEQKAHLNARAAWDLPGEPKVLKELEARRADAVTRGITRLQQSLPPATWGAVRGYINGSYRDGIRVQ